MIEIKNLNKSFNDFCVLENINLTIPDSTIFGLIGINGAGKSTLLRLLAGIYKPNEGTIKFDEEDINTSINILEDLFFLSDDPYFTMTSTGLSLAKTYSTYYPKFSFDDFNKYMNRFGINAKTKIHNLSKGMRRKTFISFALACNVKYILLDEAFDGLDPIARIDFKRVITEIVEEKKMTIIISSHSLKDLEDIVDSFAIIDNKKISSSGKLDESIDKYVKYQLAYSNPVSKELFTSLNPISLKINSRFVEIVLKNSSDINYEEELEKTNPLLLEQQNIDFENYFTMLVVERGYL